MFKRLFLLIFVVAPFNLFAQNSFLTGNIFDNESRSTAIEGATIRNLNTKVIAITDRDGHFSIAAKIGDLVTFGMVGYHTDTLYLAKLLPKNIYLRFQVNDLNTVDVKSAKVSPYLNTQDPNAKAAQRLDYGPERGGLRLNLGYGKYRRNQAKIAELEEDDKFQEEINKNFNEEYIKSLVKFQEPGIKDYMGLYRPTITQVKAETPFNYVLYIIRTYHEWQKLPEDRKKLPKLQKIN